MRVIGKTGVVIEFRGFDRGANVMRQRCQYARQLLARPGVINKVAQDQFFSGATQLPPDLTQTFLPLYRLKRRGRQAKNDTAQMGQFV